MRSLATIGPRELRRRPARVGLTAFGTALGVAVLVAVLLTTAATNEALNRSVRGAAGNADVFISASGSSDAVLARDTVTKARSLPNVQRTTVQLAFDSLLTAPEGSASVEIGLRDRIVSLVGVDLPVARAIAQYELVEGRFFKSGADEVIIPRFLAKQRRLSVGQLVRLSTPTGHRAMRLTGILEDAGAALGNQGRSVYTSIATAWRLDLRGSVVTSIAVVLDRGVDPTAWIRANRDALGPSVRVQDADDLVAGFRGFITAVSTALTLISGVGLFVGGFLVFVTFSVGVTERTRTFGTLRALGAYPRQVRRVVLVEALALGLAASLVGLLIGYGLAAASRGLTGRLFELELSPLGLPIGRASLSVAVGVGVCVVASWLPSRRAAVVNPIVAMREGASATERKGRLWWRVGILVAGVMMGLVDRPTGVRSASVLLLLLGAVLLVPFALRPLALVLGRVTARVAVGVGPIAVRHLVKERARSAYTLALVMVILAMLMATAGTNLAYAKTIEAIVDRQAGGAVQAFAPGAIDPNAAAELASVPGAATVSPVSFGETDIAQGAATRTIGVTVIDPSTYFDIAGFSWIRGNDERAQNALAAGSAVLLPAADAEALNLRLGDSVRLRTAKGFHAFALASTYALAGGDFGAVVSTTDALRFGVDRVNGFLIGAKEDVDYEELRRAIAATVAKKYSLILDTPESTRRMVFAQLRGFFLLAYVVLAIAAIAGMLGLGNTLVVSVLSRTREIGILRSAGVLRRQIFGMVFVEAVTLTLVGLVLAFPVALALLRTLVDAQRASLGVTIDVVFPWMFVPPLAVSAIAIAAIASVIPARYAARLEPVVALRFD